MKISKYPQWTETVSNADVGKMHKLASTGKDFESEIPLLLAELTAMVSIDGTPLDILMEAFVFLTKIVYLKGYERGKKERSLFMVKDKTTCENQT